ncbi:hypothetical protein ANAPC5_01272 [Anaplasma phagocytophilum]|nr:hypothetical protein ANAPC5_01272 [Anaplasma phagocytophilum]
MRSSAIKPSTNIWIRVCGQRARDGAYHHVRMTSSMVCLRRTVEAWSHVASGAQARHDHAVSHFAFELRIKAKEEVEK